MKKRLDIKLVGVLLIVMMVWQGTHAQDLHFSLPFRTPVLLNPALTGAIREDYRVATAYKNQWSSIGAPFQTTYAAYDMRVFNTGESSNRVGVGLSFFNDKAGKTDMGLTQLNLNLAYEVQVGVRKFLSAGVQAGFVQRSANYAGIRWDSQYNGVGYDPSLPSGETNMPQNNSYLDAGAGIGWKQISHSGFTLNCGLAMYHLTFANGSYIDNGNDQLNLRVVLHGEGELELDNHFAILPQLVAVNKGAASELIAGGQIKYVTGEGSKYTDAIVPSTVSLGCYYRYQDAVIVAVVYDYKRVLSIAVNYDFNVSSLKVASSSRGGIELSLVFTGFFEKQTINL